MFKNNPLFFTNFLFFQHTAFVFEKLCFAENTIKIVFSGKHSFSKTRLVKPTFSTMSKNTFFQKKVSFLFFFAISAETLFYSVSCFALFWSKKIWPKQIVCTKTRFCLPSWHKSCQPIFAENPFLLIFQIFGWPPSKNPIFIGFLCLFHFLFFFFLFLGLQHKKGKTKMQFSFRKPDFWHPPNFAKTLFWHIAALLVFLKMPPNTIKLGKTANKTWTSF